MKKYDTQLEKMTQAPIPELVITLAIPTTISMLVTGIYNLADTFFVGQLGNSASGAVGVVFSFMAILQAFGFMFGQGAGSNIARFLGAQKNEEASIYASTGFICSLAVGLLIFVLSTVFKTGLVYLLGSTDTIFPYARDYLTYMVWAAPFTMGSFTLNNILRFEGKAKLAMVGLMTGGVLNLILDPILIFALDMGVKGAALATAVSQTIGFIILLSMFMRKKTQTRLMFKLLSHKPSDYWNIVATGFPSLVRQGMGSLSGMVLNWQVKVFGDAAVAAMSIVSRVGMLIFATGLGIGQGYQPVCGYNYGAKKFSRVRSACWFTLKAAMVFIGVTSIIVLAFSGNVIGLFRNDPDVIEVGTVALQAQCLSMMILPVMLVSNMTLQSTGQKAVASFTSMLRNGLYYIPAVLILGHFFGLFGIQISQAIADTLTVITCIPILWKFIKNLPEDEM